MDTATYLAMQRRQYEADAHNWSLVNRDPVVGSYDRHNAWPDYDTLLFKGFDTSGLTALEYGCGPGRNLIRYAPRFAAVDGIDLAANNLTAARVNLTHHNVAHPRLYHNDGSTMPMIADQTYDVVFSVICLQHIACYAVRLSIFQEIHRVLKPGGRFCLQMGFGGRPALAAGYFDNVFDAFGTNGWYDVAVEHEDQLLGDLIGRVGFRQPRWDIAATGPGDNHRHWIWLQVQK